MPPPQVKSVQAPPAGMEDNVWQPTTKVTNGETLTIPPAATSRPAQASLQRQVGSSSSSSASVSGAIPGGGPSRQARVQTSLAAA